MKKKIWLFILLVFLILEPSQVFCADLSRYDAIGLKGGVWRVEKAEDQLANSFYETDAKTYSPYLELSFSLGLNKGFCLEFLLGSCSRGEIRFVPAPDEYYWESVTIVPVSIVGKYSILHRRAKGNLKPYLGGGLSYVIGSTSLDYGSLGPEERYIFSGFVKTRSTLGFLFGGGLDYAISELLWLNLDLKYQWAKFGKKVGGIKDYSGPRVTLGLSYAIRQK